MKKLEELTKNYYTEEQNNKAFYIVNGYMPSWAEEHHTDPDRGLKQYSTPTRWEQYKAGTIDRAKAVELATKRAAKEVEKELTKKLTRLEMAKAAPALGSLSISVEWVRSRTWGANPTATVQAYDQRGQYIGTYTGHASGCGYDKESAAVADALNQCPTVLKMLYENAEKALTEGKNPESKTTCTGICWSDALGYGSGYSVLPYFEGGVGIGSHQSIFNNCGYKFRRTASGKMFDCYLVEA